jgi:hypothetical protein
MVSPVRGDYRRRQAEIPLIVLCRFPGPALIFVPIHLPQPPYYEAVHSFHYIANLPISVLSTRRIVSPEVIFEARRNERLKFLVYQFPKSVLKYSLSASAEWNVEALF